MADEQQTQVGHQVVGEQETQQVEVPPPPPPPGGAQQTEVFFSRDEPHHADAAQQAGAAPTPPPPSESRPAGGTSPAEADRIASDQQDAFAQKPHLYALGAFAGAFVLAQVLKRITGDDD